MILKMKHFIIISFLTMFSLYCNNEQIVEGNTMDNPDKFEVIITIGDTVLTATLDDNPTARDFISLLPLELKLEDYAGTEKINYLPRKLSTENAPSGFDPSIGDITYYAPWGNLAIFYKDFGYANGLIKLGKIESGIELLKSSSSINVRMELVQK